MIEYMDIAADSMHLFTYQPLRERAKQEQRVGEIEISALMGFRVRYSFVIRDAYFYIYIYIN
jgi:hypothetical protein